MKKQIQLFTANNPICIGFEIVNGQLNKEYMFIVLKLPNEKYEIVQYINKNHPMYEVNLNFFTAYDMPIEMQFFNITELQDGFYKANRKYILIEKGVPYELEIADLHRFNKINPGMLKYKSKQFDDTFVFLLEEVEYVRYYETIEDIVNWYDENGYFGK